MASAAQKRLMSELVNLSKEKWVHVEVDEKNLMSWPIGLMVVNPESAFHGAYLKALMRFTNEYPFSPPTFQFLTSNIYHPNIYANGTVCISILHKPGDDEQSGEQACERWSPLQGVESVLRSVLLLLDDPEISSPANVDASVTYRDDRAEFKRRAAEVVERSQKEIPAGVHVPTPAELEPKKPAPTVRGSAMDDDAFWNETDDENAFDDLGGSDSDFDMDEYDDEEEEEDAGDDSSDNNGSGDQEKKKDTGKA